MRYLLSITFFLFFLHAFAQQTLELEWGEDQVFSKNSDFNEVVGVNGDRIFVLSSSGLKAKNSINVDLEIYSAQTLDLIKQINLVDNKSDHNFEELVITNEKILVFTSYYDRDLKLKILVSQEYDEDSNVLTDDQRVDEISVDPRDDPLPFHITVSPEGNYVLIYHDNPDKAGMKVFNLKVINYDYTSLWEKEIRLNYKEKMVNFGDVRIDESGNVYLLSSINPFGIKKSSGLGSLVNTKSTLFVYRPYDDKLKEFEFALSRNWIDQVHIDFDESQNLIATAFFTYPNDYKIRGFVLFEMNSETGEVTSRKMSTLDKNQFRKVDESIGRLKEYSRMLVGSPGIYPGSSSHMNSTSTEFITKDVIIQRDKIILAVETFRRDERCSESFSDQQMIVNCEKNFLYGDVVLFYLNRDCELKKISRVNKIQHSVNKLNPYYSFSIIGNEDGAFVFFNEDYRNMTGEPQNDKIPLSNMNKATLNIEAFDGNGIPMDLSFRINREGRIPFFPRGNMSMSEKQFLLYSQREKNYRFGKLMIQ